MPRCSWSNVVVGIVDEWRRAEMRAMQEIKEEKGILEKREESESERGILLPPK
jgi:hypothetical protein